MSKVLEATCLANTVTSGGVPVEAAVMSEGVGQSDGLLVLDKDEAYYLAKTSPDLKTTLEKLVSSLTKVTEVLTNIGAGMTGPTTAPPPTLAADVTEINTTIAELSTLKDNLR